MHENNMHVNYLAASPRACDLVSSTASPWERRLKSTTEAAEVLHALRLGSTFEII